MIIETEKLSFEDLSAGDVFTWQGNYYIKTFSDLPSSANAVNIQTGQLMQFGFKSNVKQLMLLRN